MSEGIFPTIVGGMTTFALMSVFYATEPEGGRTKGQNVMAHIGSGTLGIVVGLFFRAVSS